MPLVRVGGGDHAQVGDFRPSLIVVSGGVDDDAEFKWLFFVGFGCNFYHVCAYWVIMVIVGWI